jgi:hypothetical protein
VNVRAGSYHAELGDHGHCYTRRARETVVPGVIANNRTAVLLFTALMFAVAVAVAVMLAQHGVTHTGALAAKPAMLFHG